MEADSPDLLMANMHIYLSEILSDKKSDSKNEFSANVLDLALSPLNDSITVELFANPELQLRDKEYFTFTPFSTELEIMHDIEVMVFNSKKHLDSLYTYRSVSLAIPDIYPDYLENITFDDGTSIQSKRIEYNNKICEVLKPEIMRLRVFLTFYHTLLHLFNTSIKHAVDKQKLKEIVPYEYYEHINQLLYAVIQLSVVYEEKKQALRVDVLRFQHALGAAVGIEMADEVSQLVSFYVSPGKDQTVKTSSSSSSGAPFLLSLLLGEMRRLGQSEEVFVQCLSCALSMGKRRAVEESRFVPSLLVLHLLLLGDGEKRSVFSHPSLRSAPYLSFLQTSLRPFPLLPVVYDLSLHASALLSLCPHFTPAMAPQYMEEREGPLLLSYHLPTLLPARREEALRLMNSLSLYSHYPLPPPPSLPREVCQQLQRGLGESLGLCRTLRDDLSGFLAFKLWRKRERAGEAGEAGGGETGGGWERRDWAREEVESVVECVCLLKNMGKILRSMQPLLSLAVPLSIDLQVQQLVGGDLLPPLHRLAKRNAPQLPSLLLLRSLLLDVEAGDYRSYSRKQGRVRVERGERGRLSPLSSTQLVVLRMMARVMGNREGEYSPSLLSLAQNSLLNYSKVLERDELRIFQDFVEESLSFPSLLHSAHYLDKLTSLSSLWLREGVIGRKNEQLFSLHVERYGRGRRVEEEILGQRVRVQVGIEESLPYLLLSSLLSYATEREEREEREGGGGEGEGKREGGEREGDGGQGQGQGQGEELGLVVERTLLLLDVYNDAAHTSLHQMNTQILYDEVEAEVTLLLDLLPLLLADPLYAQAKGAALPLCLSLFPPCFPPSPLPLPEPPLLPPPFLCPPLLHLLGRALPLSLLLSPHLSRKLRADFDLLARHFEASPLSSLLDLQLGFSLLGQIHGLLSPLCPALDSLPSLLEEFRGRVYLHIVEGVVCDLLPRSLFDHYSDRFYPSPLSSALSSALSSPPSAPAGLSAPSAASASHLSLFSPKRKEAKPSSLHRLFGKLKYAKLVEERGRAYRGHVGREHLAALWALEGAVGGVESLVGEVRGHIEERLSLLSPYYDVLGVYMERMGAGLEEGLEQMRRERLRAGEGRAEERAEKRGEKRAEKRAEKRREERGEESLFLFYQERYGGLLEYSDIRYEVFQALREIGHGFLFLSLLSSAREEREERDRMNWRALTSHPFPAGEERRGEGESPLEGVVRAVQREVMGGRNKGDSSARSNNYRVLDPLSLETAPSLLRRLLEHAQSNNTLLYPSPASPLPLSPPLSLLSGVLGEMEEHLYLSSFSSAWAPRGGRSFAKFLSLLFFLFSLSSAQAAADPAAPASLLDELEAEEGAGGERERGVEDVRLFGHGVLIGGTVLLSLLQQLPLFDQVDLNLHLLSLHRLREGEGVEGGERGYDPSLFPSHLSDLADMQKQWRERLSFLFSPRPSYAVKGEVGEKKGGERREERVKTLLSLLAEEEAEEEEEEKKREFAPAHSNKNKTKSAPALSSNSGGKGGGQGGGVLAQLGGAYREEDYLI